jgi:hypothetical protein
MQVVHVSRGLISASNSGQDDVARNEYIYPPGGKVPPFILTNCPLYPLQPTSDLGI